MLVLQCWWGISRWCSCLIGHSCRWCLPANDYSQPILSTPTCWPRKRCRNILRCSSLLSGSLPKISYRRECRKNSEVGTGLSEEVRIGWCRCESRRWKRLGSVSNHHRVNARRIQHPVCICCSRQSNWNTTALLSVAVVSAWLWPRIYPNLSPSGRLGRTNWCNFPNGSCRNQMQTEAKFRGDLSGIHLSSAADHQRRWQSSFLTKCWMDGSHSRSKNCMRLSEFFHVKVVWRQTLKWRRWWRGSVFGSTCTVCSVEDDVGRRTSGKLWSTSCGTLQLDLEQTIRISNFNFLMSTYRYNLFKCLFYI